MIVVFKTFSRVNSEPELYHYVQLMHRNPLQCLLLRITLEHSLICQPRLKPVITNLPNLVTMAKYVLYEMLNIFVQIWPLPLITHSFYVICV